MAAEGKDALLAARKREGRAPKEGWAGGGVKLDEVGMGGHEGEPAARGD